VCQKNHTRACSARTLCGRCAEERAIALAAALYPLAPRLLKPSGVARILLILALLAAGCATSGPYHHHHHHALFCCHRPPTTADKALAVGELGLGALELGIALTEAMGEPDLPPPSPPRPLTKPLFGTVSWEGGGRVPAIPVTLRGTSDFVVLETTTDEGGRFWFPMPLPADWYRIIVDDERAAGETRLWLRDRRPAMLDVIARPKATVPTD